MQNFDNNKKNVIYFGGSFNPIHNGHIEIVLKALNNIFCIQNEVNEEIQQEININFDKIFFMPSFNPPHKDIEKEASYKDRCAMINIVLNKLNNNKLGLSTAEQEFYENQKIYTTYTLDILNLIKEQHNDYNIYFLVGLDSILAFDTWYNIYDLLKTFQFIVVNRNNNKNFYSIIFETNKKYNTKLLILEGINNYISSTKIRYLLKNEIKKNEILNYVDEDVLKYIIKKGLYNE